jgi:hypothetical protein
MKASGNCSSEMEGSNLSAEYCVVSDPPTGGLVTRLRCGSRGF